MIEKELTQEIFNKKVEELFCNFKKNPSKENFKKMRTDYLRLKSQGMIEGLNTHKYDDKWNKLAKRGGFIIQTEELSKKDYEENQDKTGEELFEEYLGQINFYNKLN